MAKQEFKSESKRLLDLMINSIYTNNFVVKARSIEYYIEN